MIPATQINFNEHSFGKQKSSGQANTRAVTANKTTKLHVDFRRRVVWVDTPGFDGYAVPFEALSTIQCSREDAEAEVSPNGKRR